RHTEAAPSHPILVRSQAPRRAGFSGAVAWVALAGLIAVPLYLITPRSSYGKWDLGQPRIEVSYSADQMVDLNQTGTLRDNPEAAFEVEVTDAHGRPKEDLNPNQRWRGSVLINYTGGTWKKDAQTQFPSWPDVARPVGPWTPPDLGPDSYKITFTLPT